MIKIYSKLTALSLAISTLSMAQPTFTSSVLPTPGMTLTGYEVNAAGISAGPSGANQTWNFSSFAPTGTSTSSVYTTPASTPFGATFPSATIASYTPTSQGNNGYSYFTSSCTYFDLIGLAIQATSPNPNVVYTYSNPSRVMVFPYTYLTTFSDTYSAFASYTANGVTINQYRSGSLTSLGDGYGTITTPAGTYTNALRVHNTEVTTDSSVYVGIPIPATVLKFRYSTYGWAKLGFTDNIYSIVYDTITLNGQPNSTSISAYYGIVSTGLHENSVSLKTFDVYPNPSASATINLKVDALNAGETKFTATDMTGKVCKEFNFTLMNTKRKSVSVDAGDLTPGLYLIRLEQDGNIFTSKFLKR